MNMKRMQNFSFSAQDQKQRNPVLTVLAVPGRSAAGIRA